MKCPNCQTENPQENNFGRECGTELSLRCPQCGAEVLVDDKFCGKCGQRLDEEVETMEAGPEIEGERKQATVLFSDLSGYTALTQMLDPEDVKETMGIIFREISKVGEKYDRLTERFFGDEVLILFGIPNAHEDDPIRAIRAAREIHELFKARNPELEEPELEEKVGQLVALGVR